MNFVIRNLLALVLAGAILPAAMAGDAAPYWIDVRSPGEYATGHLDSAVNIPHREIADRIAEVTQDHAAEIHLYCASGGRAELARKALMDMGYTNVTNDGGYRNLVCMNDDAGNCKKNP